MGRAKEGNLIQCRHFFVQNESTCVRISSFMLILKSDFLQSTTQDFRHIIFVEICFISSLKMSLTCIKLPSHKGNFIHSKVTLIQGDTKKTVITKIRITSKVLFILTQNFSYIRSRPV